VQSQPDTNYFKFFYKSQISLESVRNCVLQSWSQKTILPGATSTSASFYLFAENKCIKNNITESYRTKLWDCSENYYKTLFMSTVIAVSEKMPRKRCDEWKHEQERTRM